MNIKNQLLLLMTITIVTVMTAAACLLNNKEIIFPEIAAIAAGGLMAPNLAWNMDKKRILLFILLCAVLGVGIVILIPLPLWAQMSLAFLLAQISMFRDDLRPHAFRRRPSGYAADGHCPC